jgi:hypothetical protein
MGFRFDSKDMVGGEVGVVERLQTGLPLRREQKDKRLFVERVAIEGV